MNRRSFLKGLGVAVLAMVASAGSASAAKRCTVLQFTDTQFYWEISPEPAKMLDHILATRESWAPGFPSSLVVHPGDIVNHPGQGARNQMWLSQFHRLDGEIPWHHTTGDHDGLWNVTPIDYTIWASIYNTSMFEAIDQPPGAIFLGTWGNSWQINSAMLVPCGDGQLLSIAIGDEYWLPVNAASIVGARALLDQYPNTPAVITVHEYIGMYCIGGRNLNGAYLWEELIEHSETIILVMSGHHVRSCTFESQNLRGRTIVETMFNTQDMGESPSIGDGWLVYRSIDLEAGTMDIMPWTTVRGVTAEQDGQPPHWHGRSSFSPVPEPSGTLGLIVGCLALAVVAETRIRIAAAPKEKT